MALPAVMRFPNPVNEVVARLVAAGVVLEASAYLVTRWPILLVTLAVGFVLRVLTGPRLSPLALLVTRVVVPRLDVEPRWVPGPPKRFAQGIGATLTVGALVAWLAGAAGLAAVLVGLVVVAATLESVLAICLGCRIFALLMRAGIIPPEVCLACSDLSGRLAAATTAVRVELRGRRSRGAVGVSCRSSTSARPRPAGCGSRSSARWTASSRSRRSRRSRSAPRCR